MRRIHWSIASLLTLSLVASHALAAETATNKSAGVIGRHVESFNLTDAQGQSHALADFRDHKLVVLAFLGTECPLAKLYAPRLAKLAAEYQGRNVAFLGLNANRQDSPAEIARFAREYKLDFPVLKDLANRVADELSAERTPEVFVLDAGRTVRYAGRIDDQYGIQDGANYQLPEARRRDLAIALDELLADKPVSVPHTETSGCLIGRVREPVADSAVTYSNQVSRILNKNCVYCHRAGQLAPFALSNYDDVVGWAAMIKEVVTERRMPPWHADPRYGHFVNDARLSDDDLRLISQWVDSGAPRGNPEDLPEAPKFAEGWLIPEPDQVVYMREEPYTVPAEGTVPYERFVVDPGWTEDKWIKAIEPRPGNPAVVHHVVMYLMLPSAPKKGAAGRLRNDWLAAYAPGLRPQILPDGIARYAPAGSKLVFELHYTPNGIEQTDRSYLGIVFADAQSVKKELAVKNAGNFSFIIPPGEDNYRVESAFKFRDDTLLWSVSPHMHLRGKDFNYKVVYPDGREEMVLSVPHYDFAWQTTYVLSEPKLLPKGSELRCVAHFDNSEHNLNNPDSTISVRFGEQTWEEMMFGWFEMALANQDLTLPQAPPVARATQFLVSLQGGDGGFDEQLRQTSGKALDKPEDFQFFAYFLADRVPQVDRVCITYEDDGHLRAQYVEEMNGVKTTLRTNSTLVTAKDQALTAALASDQPTVYDDLSLAPGPLAKRMVQRGLASSVHIPVRLEGRRVTVNFWSTEAKAFPAAAVELLTTVAQRMVAGR